MPFRFFLTAPWFGVAAGLLLSVSGAEFFASRWMPATLAATHLVVAGFMLQAMCGALLQFIPVAAGGNIRHPHWVAGFVHPVLSVSAALLAGAFLTQHAVLFFGAAHGFGFALGIFFLAAGYALWKTPAQGATIIALRSALVGLAVTVAVGILLATGLAKGDALPVLALTDIHAAWGLGGWALALLAGVSYFVVPMFQLTPPYPARFARTFPYAMLSLLLLWTGQLTTYPESVRKVLLLLMLGMGGVYGTVTLMLQARRRRKVSDHTLKFFRTAMLSLVALPCVMAVFFLWPGMEENPRVTVFLGVLLIVGVFVSAIEGMLYKIVPFISWLHLQRIGGLTVPPPAMNAMLSESAVRGQYYAHQGALLLLLLAVWLPELARFAGLAFALDCAWLGGNLLWAVRAYARFKSRIPAAAPG